MEEKRILLAHGSGGRMSRELIERYLVRQFENPMLSLLNDQAVFPAPAQRLAFTTDSYVIDPIFFPGGDIGRLAVCGTVNDLAMSGAVPLYLSCSLIIEEGFLFSDLERILCSMKEACEEAKVQVVTGDTKVVNRGGLDKIFINTSGVGALADDNLMICGHRAQVGDKILVSGFLGDHEIAVLSQRKNLEFITEIRSDSAPLNLVVEPIIQQGLGQSLHAMRDPTRGGLATVLNEIASQSGVGLVIEEALIPIRDEVKGACEIMGFDPLYLANEGKLVAFVEGKKAHEVLSVMRDTKYGQDAQIIGEVVAEPKGVVYLRTSIGGTRILDMLATEQLPRIC
ncbi:MAG: hydrogenase expression/formation protein HypE [bacterium]|nr:hydrogenase expression/formation protein HypE [bacterium]